MNSHTVFDVVIVGAGPAGCTAALALQGSGLSVALLEKGRFPRDKVCGDAIPGPAFKTLYELNPDWGEQLFALKAQQRIYESEFVLSKDRGLGMEWKMKTYNARRLDFDNHLWEMVQQHTETKTYEDTFVKSITPKDNGVVLHTARQQSFFAKVIIGADGANGVTARQLAGYRLNRAHHCAAVRAYYRNVDHLEPNKNLFFTQKKFLPGYFWIFPLGEGIANVGFGMLSTEIAKEKINLRKLLPEIISDTPQLQHYFRNAIPEGPVKGFGLPIGSGATVLSGERFLLCGDAGSLIDPLAGHGIDLAMASAVLAVEIIRKAAVQDNFSAAFLKQYDQAVQKRFGAGFRRNYRIIQSLKNFPWLLNLSTAFADSPPGRWFIDKHLRKFL